MAKKKKEMEVPQFPMVVETFNRIGDWELNRLQFKEASCFNGITNFRRYRITVELIDEPIEILGERLEKLWVECDNHHNYQPLRAAAASIGYTFKGEHGSQRKTKTY